MPNLTSLTLAAGAATQLRSTLPMELVAGTGVDPRPSLRVQEYSSSYEEGRQFRTFQEFSIAAAGSLVIRLVTTTDVNILQRTLTLTAGTTRVAFKNGGTAGGTFTALPALSINFKAERASPAYATGTVPTSGGTVTGGTERCVDMGLSNGAGVRLVNTELLGIPAGTYFFVLSNPGLSTATGVFDLRWEEVQPRSSVIQSGPVAGV